MASLADCARREKLSRAHQAGPCVPDPPRDQRLMSGRFDLLGLSAPTPPHDDDGRPHGAKRYAAAKQADRDVSSVPDHVDWQGNSRASEMVIRRIVRDRFARQNFEISPIS
jgi:hypothetical protein